MLPVELLKATFASKRNDIFIVAGAGVASAATRGAKYATWRGLLEDGLATCGDPALGLSSKWLAVVRETIELGDAEALIHAAQRIEKALRGSHNGQYSRWLRDTVGSLRAVETRLILQLARLGAGVITTNYDNLFEEVTGRPAVLWTNAAGVHDFFRNRTPAILHLHGHFSSPDSIVFSDRDYQDICRDPQAQLALGSSFAMHTWVFVGCGGGLADPHFDSVFKWIGPGMKDSEAMHFHLLKNSELAEAATRYRGLPIVPVAYGDSYNELPDFLDTLGVDTHESALDTSPPIEPLSLSQRAFDESWRTLLSSLKNPSTEYRTLEDAMNAIRQLWLAGGRRRAALTASSFFQKHRNRLPIDACVAFGIEAATMLLDDDLPGMARELLATVLESTEGREIPPTLTHLLALIETRCLADLCNINVSLNAMADAKRMSNTAMQSDMEAWACEVLFLSGRLDEALARSVQFNFGKADFNGFAMEPDAPLIRRCDPQTRIIMTRERCRAMAGQYDAIGTLTAHASTLDASTQSESFVATVLLAAELHCLNQESELACQLIRTELTPIIEDLPVQIQLVVRRNLADAQIAAMDDGGHGTFYDVVDAGRSRGFEWFNSLKVLNAVSSAENGRHYDAFPSLWRELCAAYDSCSWYARTQLDRYFAEECRRIGDLEQSLTHAIQSEDERLSRQIAADILAKRDRPLIQRVVASMIGYCNLRNHFSCACRVIESLSDAIETPDAVCDWLLPHCGRDWEPVLGVNSVGAAWKALESIASRLDDNHVQHVLDVAINHPSWVAIPQGNSVIVLRDEIIGVLSEIVDRLSVSDLQRLVESLLPLAKERRQSSDYREVLNLLAQIALLDRGAIKFHICSSLFKPGTRIDNLLGQLGPMLGAPVPPVEQLVSAAYESCKQVRSQVELVADGQEQSQAVGVFMTSTMRVRNQTVVVHLGAMQGIQHVARYAEVLPRAVCDSLVEAMLEMLGNPHNLLGNREALCSTLLEFRDVISEHLRRRVQKTVRHIASGEIIPGTTEQRSEDLENPLNSFKAALGRPSEVFESALRCWLYYTTSAGRRVPRQAVKVIARSLRSRNAATRAATIRALAGQREIPEFVANELFLATRDTSEGVALAAFATLSQIDSSRMTTPFWRMFLQATRMALDSASIRIRHQAAIALGLWLKESSPRSVQHQINGILEVIGSDISALVRDAIKH